MLFTLSSLDHTALFGATLARAMLQEREVRTVLFYGDLGSGKTTMTRAFVAALPLGVHGEEAEVSSPSFTLCNLYPTQPEVAHFDLYRLEHGPTDDALLDAFDEEGIVLVEWAERLNLADAPLVRLHLDWQRCGELRQLRVSPYGAAAQKVVDFLAQSLPELVQS